MSEEPKSNAPQLRDELDQVLVGAFTSPAVRRRKLLLWVVRQAIMCLLAWLFWDRVWMRWLFVFGVVVALIHLAMIFILPIMLRRRAEKAHASISNMDSVISASEEPHRSSVP